MSVTPFFGKIKTSRTVGEQWEMNNLKSFRKGQSGNPKGRPKGAKDGLRAYINRALRKDARPEILALLKKKGVDLDNGSNSAVIAFALIKMAQAGDVSAIKLIFDQTEMPLPKQVELSGSLTLTAEQKRKIAEEYLR